MFKNPKKYQAAVAWDKLQEAEGGPANGQSAAEWQAELLQLQADYQAAHEAAYGKPDEAAKDVVKHILDHPFGFDA